MARTVKIEGARELERALEELGKKAALKVGRAALRKAARAILLEARARVPVNEGRLKKALTVTVDRGRHSKAELYATVKVKKGPNYRPRTTDRKTVTRGGKKVNPGYSYQIGSTPEVYGAFIEFGAPARNIAPRGYMRGAWDAEGGETALDRIGEELGAGIEREAAKAKKG